MELVYGRGAYTRAYGGVRSRAGYDTTDVQHRDARAGGCRTMSVWGSPQDQLPHHESSDDHEDRPRDEEAHATKYAEAMARHMGDGGV